MATHETQTSKRLPIVVLAKRLIKLERSGRYDDGLEMFGEGWSEPAFLPEVADLPAGEAAEIMLRFGSLIGFYGYKHQIEGSQERSKNIITAARESFSLLSDVAKTAECENYISLAYWRTGECKEAETWIESALSYDLPNSNDARLYAHVTKSLIFLSEKRYEENVLNCLALESDFRTFGDAFINASVCSNLGLSFKNLFQNAEAMRYFDLACEFHERTGHKVYLATVHNNIAQLHKAERRYGSAHRSVDAATKLFKQVKDKTREAFCIDTKAQIYLAEHKLSEALGSANKAIAILRKGEFSACLAESLLTRSKALLLANNFADAILSLVEAVSITQVQHGEDAAKVLIDEFEAVLKDRDQSVKKTRPIEKGELELVLPASIGNYSDYKGVWINTSHLESMGIKPGSLAIIVPEKIKRGDLVAITDIKNDTVICGVYDSEFGIVCLERGDDDPQLFDENDIRVLGKIVGVCNAGKNAAGQMTVEPI